MTGARCGRGTLSPHLIGENDAATERRDYSASDLFAEAVTI